MDPLPSQGWRLAGSLCAGDDSLIPSWRSNLHRNNDLYLSHPCAGRDPCERSECLITPTSKPELRCWDGPPAFAGAESGFAGVTERLCLGHFVIPSQEGIHLSAANVSGGSVNFALRCWDGPLPPQGWLKAQRHNLIWSSLRRQGSMWA